MAEHDLGRSLVDGSPEHVIALAPPARAGADGADSGQRLRALLLECDLGDDPGVHDAQPVLGEVREERRILEERPVDWTQRMREIAMHATHRRLGRRLPVHPRLPRRAPIEQLLLVIPSHHDRSGAPDHIEHAQRIRPARDEIAHEHEAISGRKGHPIEQRLELDPTPMHVADDDRPHRFRAHKKRGVRRVRKGSR